MIFEELPLRRYDVCTPTATREPECGTKHTPLHTLGVSVHCDHRPGLRVRATAHSSDTGSVSGKHTSTLINADGKVK